MNLWYKGFRKGEVPLDMVEKNVQPAYVQLALYEEAMHQGTIQIVKEHEDIKFIGNIYDLQQEEKDGAMIFTYKLDIYPDVETKNTAWEKASIEALDSKATDEEIEETLTNLQKQYADYQPHDIVQEDTICKVTFQILDTSGAEIDKGSLFIGKEEFDEFAIMKQHFVGKKEWEDIQIDYIQEDLPPMLHMKNTEAEGEPTHIHASVSDIRKVQLPERNEETIKKLFGNQELKSLDELKAKVAEAIEWQKKEALLMQGIEAYLSQTKESFDIIIPKTLIDEEMKSRMKSLEERFGWEDWLKQYYEKIGEEQKTQMDEEIKNAAKTSLEKFFLLRRVVELLELDIKDEDRQTPMAIEGKLYDHFNK